MIAFETVALHPSVNFYIAAAMKGLSFDTRILYKRMLIYLLVLKCFLLNKSYLPPLLKTIFFDFLSKLYTVVISEALT
jgi:hypothetical protein